MYSTDGSSRECEFVNGEIKFEDSDEDITSIGSSVISSPDTTSETEENAPTDIASQNETETGTNNTFVESQIKVAANQAFGNSNVESITYDADANYALIKAKGSDNLTNKMVVKGMYKSIYDTLKGLDGVGPLSLDFNVTFPMVDKYGNSNEEIVIKATYNNETREKLNFDRLIFEKIDGAADDWWMHSALEEALN